MQFNFLLPNRTLYVLNSETEGNKYLEKHFSSDKIITFREINKVHIDAKGDFKKLESLIFFLDAKRREITGSTESGTYYRGLILQLNEKVWGRMSTPTPPASPLTPTLLVDRLPFFAYGPGLNSLEDDGMPHLGEKSP